MSGADPFGHLGHCQSLGRMSGEEGPWLQSGGEHVGQENDPGPELVPRQEPSSYCALGAQFPTHNRVRRQKLLEEKCCESGKFQVSG